MIGKVVLLAHLSVLLCEPRCALASSAQSPSSTVRQLGGSARTPSLLDTAAQRQQQQQRRRLPPPPPRLQSSDDTATSSSSRPPPPRPPQHQSAVASDVNSSHRMTSLPPPPPSSSSSSSAQLILPQRDGDRAKPAAREEDREMMLDLNDEASMSPTMMVQANRVANGEKHTAGDIDVNTQHHARDGKDDHWDDAMEDMKLGDAAIDHEDHYQRFSARFNDVPRSDLKEETAEDGIQWIHARSWDHESLGGHDLPAQSQSQWQQTRVHQQQPNERVASTDKRGEDNGWMYNQVAARQIPNTATLTIESKGAVAAKPKDPSEGVSQRATAAMDGRIVVEMTPTASKEDDAEADIENQIGRLLLEPEKGGKEEVMKATGEMSSSTDKEPFVADTERGQDVLTTNSTSIPPQQQQQQQQQQRIRPVQQRGHQPPPQLQQHQQQRQKSPPPPPQQQHQHQQHQRNSNQGRTPKPPRPNQRPPNPNRQPNKSGKDFSVMGLWRRVEKGLDGLATLEDAVSDRATRLVSSVTTQVAPSRAPNRQQRPTTTSQRQQQQQPQRPQNQQNPRVPTNARDPKTGSNRNSRGTSNQRQTQQRRQQQKPNQTAPAKEPPTQQLGAFASFGKKYEDAIAKKKAAEAARKASAARTSVTAARKMIHPVGGAMNPEAASADGNHNYNDPGRNYQQQGMVSQQWQGTASPTPSNTQQSQTAGANANANANAGSAQTYEPALDGSATPPNRNGANTSNVSNQGPNEERVQYSNTASSASTQGPPSMRTSYPVGPSTNTNPYLQQSVPKQRNVVSQKSKAAAAAQDRRGSRIPWSEMVSSSSSNGGGRAGVGGPSQMPASNSARNRRSFGDDDNDDERQGFLSKIGSFIPSIPSPKRLFRRGSSDSYSDAEFWGTMSHDDDDDTPKRGIFGWFRRSNAGANSSTNSAKSDWRRRVDSQETVSTPLSSLTSRCDDGKNTCLLSADDQKRAKLLGQYQGNMDFLCALFLVLGFKILPDFSMIPFDSAWSAADVASQTVPALGTVLADSLLSWAPFAFAVAYLLKQTSRLWINPEVNALTHGVARAVEAESRYGQLYLRLVAAMPVEHQLADSMRTATSAQVMSLVSASRLRWFVSTALIHLVVMTATSLQSGVVAIMDSLVGIVSLQEWRSWPVPWKELLSHIKQLLQVMLVRLEGVVATSATAILDHPLQAMFFGLVLTALAITSVIPNMEENRNVVPPAEDDDDQALHAPLESMDHLSKLGASSANRLSMLSEDGSVENVLERWRSQSAATAASDTTIEIAGSLVRVTVLRLLAVMVIIAPFLLYAVLNSSIGLASGLLAGQSASTELAFAWSSILDASMYLIFAMILSWQAIGKIVAATDARGPIMNFLSTLSQTVAEIASDSSNQADISFNASLSPSAGIAVRDLWTAHTSKRAWAVRGANFECRNGEILVVLGDDGCGKTRLLTSLAETIISPPKRSLSSSKVRGSISIGGVDAAKWDRSMLKRRTGILLNDIRTAADTASIVSGLTLEEVLEPLNGSKTLDPGRQLSAVEKASMLLSMKITGLYTSLLPKLPSKWSTVITANEEDLRPSPLRPRSTVLSPSEWSKLLLAKILAQTISDNDNSAASNDKIDSCLMGSVLILDDPTVLLSEVEEATLLNKIRRTGAATVMSTNKWATGRFADKVAVIKDGRVVETGTHNELLSRGPQQSLYAAKWQAMTMQ